MKELTLYEEYESFLRNVIAHWSELTNGQPLDTQGGGCGMRAGDVSIYGWAFSSTLNKARILMEKEKLGSIAGATGSACHSSVTETGTESQGSFKFSFWI